MDLLKPKGLQRGDTIGVVAPAGPVDRQRIDRAFERVRARGYRIKTYGDIYRATGYLAGDDATRAAELMAAFADPQSRAVWCARGGYGVMRMLNRLDFDAVRRHPKVFVGFSDITALHIALQQRAGLATFHGPNLQDGFGKENDIPSENEAALWRALAAGEQQATQPAYELPLVESDDVELRSIHGGVARGQLTGGNLAVLVGLMGTPFEVDTAGRILFLEDVSERLYRIDRYLAQLELAGKLQAAAGVLVGAFSYEEGEQSEPPDAVASLLDEYLGRLRVPVLSGFPAGHDRYNLTLPMGTPVELDADRARLKILQAAVSTD